MLDKITKFAAEPLPRRILFFDDLLTPSMIRVVYWLGLLSVVWTGLGRMFSNGFFGFFEGIVYVVIGVIVLRVIAELVMLLFKINENIEVMAGNAPIEQTPVTVAEPVAPQESATKPAAAKKPAAPNKPATKPAATNTTPASKKPTTDSEPPAK